LDILELLDAWQVKYLKRNFVIIKIQQAEF